MYKAPGFDSIVTIESIKNDNFLSYVYLKILSPKPHSVNKAYKIWFENLDTKILSVIDNNTYYIDRYRDDSSSGAAQAQPLDYININRNKTVCLKINLSQLNVLNNHFVCRCRLHLKEHTVAMLAGESVYISDDITLTSREIKVPTIECKSVSVINKPAKITSGILSADPDNGKLMCRLSLKFPTSRDETNFNLYLKTYVSFFDGNNLMECEEVGDQPDNNILDFKSINKYGNKVTKIKVEIRYYNDAVAKSQTFVLNAIKKFKAFIADEEDIAPCVNLYQAKSFNVSGTPVCHKIVDIYQKY